MTDSGQETGQGEEHPAAEDQDTAFPDIPTARPPRARRHDSHAGAAMRAGDREQQAERQADLDVVQMQIGADERPGRIGDTEDQFVEEFDQEEDQVNHE